MPRDYHYDIMTPNRSSGAQPRLVVTVMVFGLLVACTATDKVVTSPPPNGILRVITTTAGGDFDPDGYVLQVGSSPERQVAGNDNTQEYSLPAGTYPVVLNGIATNCGLVTNPPEVVVAPGATAIVHLAVTCTSLPGTVDVTVSTAGEDPDFGGYVVLVDGVSSGRIVPNGSLELPGLPPGSHAVALDEIASNCSGVGAMVINVDVHHAAAAEAAFSLTCHHTAKVVYASQFHIYTMNEDGTGIFAIRPTFTGSTPAWSPDGSQIAMGRYTPDTVYMADADGSHMHPLGNAGAAASDPAWSPDGRRLAITIRPAVRSSYIATCDLQGGDVRQLTTGEYRDQQAAWSPDGTRIVFVREDPATSVRHLFAMKANGTGLVQLSSDVDDREPAWSPDGSLIAFTGQGPTGERRVYLIHPDGTGRESLLPTSQRVWGYRPNWIVTGTQIMASDENHLYTVSLATRQQISSTPIGEPLVGVQSFSWRP
jgi:hypothetical protein